ncbi:MAG TPA: hydantoinase B/oxoprolinase family protein [Stellaceae bacterium]|nr:hydantoinase B/oxoprolinase family protein [Stellaceae bacterium]
MTIDPVTTEVVASRLREAAATMEHALYHSGYSPILRESKDGTAGLADAEGRVVIVGGGIQYHFMQYQLAVQAVLARYPKATLKPGESFITNDPYKAGSSHVPDMVAITPGFHDGVLIGFGVSVAHKADVGGLVPGSSGAAAREIFHDGLLLPPVRFQTEAGIDEAVEAIIASNSRIPEVLLGDLRAQVGATRIGVARLAALCGEYGRDTVLAVMESLMTLAARRVRAELGTWRDGTAEAEGFLDHDGAVKDRPVRIHVRATKEGERLRLDFSGSSPQTLGPVNLVTSTAKAVSLLALLTTTDPDIPVNFGLTGAVEFVIPPGLVVSPQHPATVNHYFPTAHLVYNCVLAALGQLNPVRAVAPSGLGSGAVSIGYRRARTGKPAVLYELLNTSLGGTSTHDGTPIVMAMCHFTPGAPVEIIESEYPLRVRAFELVRDSAGAGRHRGGVGYAREFEMLEDSVLTVRSANHRFTAWGHGGGGAPRAARVVLNPGRADSEELGPIETRALKAGDVIRFERSGGAGFGPPEERALEAVRADVADGYVSAEAAETVYRRKLT